ncbi:uncharacterized protein [Anoplolepis gracilipes]|uniref:uncharacterized protein n=1 Tax=Anoplolepis gracilipes TaxID=354296 RepID=UPI003BA119F1
MSTLVCKEIEGLPPPTDEVFSTPGTSFLRGKETPSPGPSPVAFDDVKRNLFKDLDSDTDVTSNRESVPSRPKRKTRAIISDESDDEEEEEIKKKRTTRSDVIDLTGPRDSMSSLAHYADSEGTDPGISTGRKNRRGDGSGGGKTIKERMRQVPLDLEVLKDHSSLQLKIDAKKWVDDLEIIRKECGNLNGPCQRLMKERLLTIGEVITLLAEREEDRGDPATLKRKNLELTTAVANHKREIARLKKDISDMQRVMESLQATITREQTYKKVIQADRGTSPIKEIRTIPMDPKETEYNRKFPALVPAMEEEKKVSNKERASQSEHYFVAPKPQRVPRNRPAAPRIISNIQLKPPKDIIDSHRGTDMRDHLMERASPTNNDSPGWTKVRKNRRNPIRNRRTNSEETPKTKEASEPPKRTQELEKLKSKRRAPTTSAIVIQGNNPDFSYADAIRKARQNISMEELGIEKSRIRQSINGNWIIEIAGPDNKNKAEDLKAKLIEVIGMEAKITRPVVKGDIRVSGFDGSLHKDDILKRLAELGDCKVSDLKIGEIRPMKIGLFMTWVQCSLSTAIRIAKTTRTRIGWTTARIELLEAKPMQCYRCWEFGHTRVNCRSTNDRMGCCFKCGERGHQVTDCPNPACCFPCKQKGLDYCHRTGNYMCGAKKLATGNKAPKP